MFAFPRMSSSGEPLTPLLHPFSSELNLHRPSHRPRMSFSAPTQAPASSAPSVAASDRTGYRILSPKTRAPAQGWQCQAREMRFCELLQVWLCERQVCLLTTLPCSAACSTPQIASKDFSQTRARHYLSPTARHTDSRAHALPFPLHQRNAATQRHTCSVQQFIEYQGR